MPSGSQRSVCRRRFGPPVAHPSAGARIASGSARPSRVSGIRSVPCGRHWRSCTPKVTGGAKAHGTWREARPTRNCSSLCRTAWLGRLPHPAIAACRGQPSPGQAGRQDGAEKRGGEPPRRVHGRQHGRLHGRQHANCHGSLRGRDGRKLRPPCRIVQGRDQRRRARDDAPQARPAITSTVCRAAPNPIGPHLLEPRVRQSLQGGPLPLAFMSICLPSRKSRTVPRVTV